MKHTLEQLQCGVHDFCDLVDQMMIGFMWHWVLMPKILEAEIKQDLSVRAEEAMEVVRNATIESSLISIRVLDEFFSSTNVRRGDIRAHHYTEYLAPGGTFLTTAEFDAIGRRIAHLTIDRGMDGPTNPWQLTDLISRCAVSCSQFLSFVVEGAGNQYLPRKPFNVASRLEMCRGISQLMRRILLASREGPQHPGANVIIESMVSE